MIEGAYAFEWLSDGTDALLHTEFKQPAGPLKYAVPGVSWTPNCGEQLARQVLQITGCIDADVDPIPPSDADVEAQ